jgi:hypothetical protein
MNSKKARSGSRTIIGLLAALGLVAMLAMPTFAASVTPEFVNQTANLECDAFEGEGQSWITLKVDPNPDGAGPFVYTDGTLTVTITNAEGDKSFDWTSNIGVDAVYVKAGAGGSNLYRYDPPAESMGDTDLASPGDSGNGISHISFCYDTGDATPTPTPTPTPTASPTPTGSVSQGTPTPTASPSPSPRGQVLAGNPTPTPRGATLPDTAMSEFAQTPAAVLSLVLLVALAGLVYLRMARQR